MKELIIAFIISCIINIGGIAAIKYIPEFRFSDRAPAKLFISNQPPLPFPKIKPTPYCGIPTPVSEDSLRKLDSLDALKNHEPWPRPPSGPMLM